MGCAAAGGAGGVDTLVTQSPARLPRADRGAHAGERLSHIGLPGADSARRARAPADPCDCREPLTPVACEPAVDDRGSRSHGPADARAGGFRIDRAAHRRRRSRCAAAALAPSGPGRDPRRGSAAGGGSVVTYTIPRYPVHLIDVVEVADGSRLTIRPTLPQDVELQQEFFRGLSAEGRYCRFMTRLNELPEALVERFASIDYRSHLALLAEVFEDGRETMIGEARYVVDARDPATCEFAIAVADDWQARGVARTLLDRLEQHAAASGIGRMAADTLLGNRAMIGLAMRAGYAVTASCEDATLARLEKSLSPSAPPLSVRRLAA
ncbi:MAG: GNAT family N-acetyltransferase [Alphaproteobacteria bacterium]|nr:MAG: GNAT family N-acetyltransferase [Alphaproteobacteria bacterium]